MYAKLKRRSTGTVCWIDVTFLWDGDTSRIANLLRIRSYVEVNYHGFNVANVYGRNQYAAHLRNQS
jgi:hypothetical protein